MDHNTAAATNMLRDLIKTCLICTHNLALQESASSSNSADLMISFLNCAPHVVNCMHLTHRVYCASISLPPLTPPLCSVLCIYLGIVWVTFGGL